MDGITVPAIMKAVAEYGVLGLGWVAWILTMYYLRWQQEKYQALVIHIIQYFTQINAPESQGFDTEVMTPRHQQTFTKLFRGK